MKKFSVRLELGNYCNLKCPHCARVAIKDAYKLNSKHVSLKDVKKWLSSYFLINNVSTIFLSGLVAEPTLNPEFLEIVKYLSQYCIVMIDSNGSTNNETWWKSLGSCKNIKCTFSPDSLSQDNNQYRINSNTNKVIANMKAFVSSGGNALWKYIPFKHNEDELEEHKKISKAIGAKFLLVQPNYFDPDAEGQTIKPSKHFPNSKHLVGSHKVNQKPNYYCRLLGEIDNLIEISPDGVIYPCCYAGRHFFVTYANFFANGDPKPQIYTSKNFIYNERYESFITDIVSLIEKQGGIKSLSLNHNTIDEILETDFFKFSLKKSWETGNKFCTEHCGSRQYVFSKT